MTGALYDEHGQPLTGPDGPVYLTTTEVAARFRTNANTVRQWRHSGTGPKGTRFGMHVLYRLDDVEAWERAKYDAERRTEAQVHRIYP